MRRVFSALLCCCICICLSSCQGDSSKYTSNYDERYHAGYEDGLWDGAFECKKDFANAIRDKYFEIESASRNDRYFHPEEAIVILNDYLDGEYVTDRELENAIETITDFYLDWQSIIANIEDVDVDIYFDNNKYIYLD